ncbi:hypothetical protein CEXT_350581 [Caerostris extrusa]|uniref:Uncharacterized protein n=1 Tax=Caerostris extrusa TaxID=172846 RepID=A0AAV4Y268_CAEEX|nr:hypothetical protein CEXT_350581 [Caerostris extrusa]
MLLLRPVMISLAQMSTGVWLWFYGGIDYEFLRCALDVRAKCLVCSIDPSATLLKGQGRMYPWSEIESGRALTQEGEKKRGDL